MRFNQGIVDVHVHVHGGCGVDKFLRNTRDHISTSGVDMENLLCVKTGPSACITETQALLAKAVYPGKFSVLGNPTFIVEPFGITAEGVAGQVRDFLEAGLDGVKLGYGNAGRETPLDSEVFDPMFSVLEEFRAPILYHIGTFPYTPPRRVFQKNRSQVQYPPFVLYQGPQDEDQPEKQIGPMDMNEPFFEQTEKFLEKHPDLNLILPHMYFMADDLDRLADFIDRHPNVNIDLTPAFQLYYYMSQDPEKSRDFLCTYRKRFLFGSDNWIEADPTLTLINERTFFETDEAFFSAHWGVDLHGINLPKDVREDIYRNNYMRLFPKREVDPKKAAVYVEKVFDIVRNLEELPEPNKMDVLEAAKRFRSMI